MLSFSYFFTLILTTSVCAQDGLSQRHIEWATPVKKSLNLFQVNTNFYRSEQMQQKDIDFLHQLGIKTVVSLRAFHDDHQLLERTGITTKRVRFYTWRVKDKEVIEALRLIRDSEKLGPVLLHCQHGADRTGLVTAMYRMVYQGWDRHKAIQELKDGGYGYHAMWKNIVKYLMTVNVESIRAQLDVEVPQT